jgi:putative membrane protein
MKGFKINFNGSNFSLTSARFWTKILVMTIAIFLTSYMFSIAKVSNPLSALGAAIVISLLNAFLRPILTLVSMPLIMASFGLFFLVINAFIVLLTSAIIPGFDVKGFWDAMLFSIIVTLISYLLELPIKRRGYRKTLEEDKEKEEFTSYEDVTDEENQEN